MKLKLVVACDRRGGIGKNGTLPWNIPTDLKHFQKLTRGKNDSSAVVLMGRNTWESIPAKFRPLKGRTNIVVSRTLQSENCLVFRSLDDACNEIMGNPKYDAENLWCIGGAQLYKSCLSEGLISEIFLTKVNENFDCDTFLDLKGDLEKCVEKPDERFQSKIHTENGIDFSFHKFVQE